MDRRRERRRSIARCGAAARSRRRREEHMARWPRRGLPFRSHPCMSWRSRGPQPDERPCPFRPFRQSPPPDRRVAQRLSACLAGWPGRPLLSCWSPSSSSSHSTTSARPRPFSSTSRPSSPAPGSEGGWAASPSPPCRHFWASTSSCRRTARLVCATWPRRCLPDSSSWKGSYSPPSRPGCGRSRPAATGPCARRRARSASSRVCCAAWRTGSPCRPRAAGSSTRTTPPPD